MGMYSENSTVEQPPEIKALFGEFPNSTPRGWREIDAQEYMSQFQTWGTGRGSEYLGYMIRDADGKDLPERFHGVHAFYYHDNTGLAVCYQYGNVAKNDLVRSDYQYTPRYFAFGCKHESKAYGYDEAKKNNWPYTSGNCYHNVRCMKCGANLSYDSSD